MQTIKELLDKIKWDKKENSVDYELGYLDRISDSIKGLKYSDIERIEGGDIVIKRDGKEVIIPMRRIKVVKKKGVVVWKRKDI